MQKISSYLYPNRINLVADVSNTRILGGWEYITRWNIVYQNKVKIYQGIDNVLTLDVKNNEQKRIDISEMNLKMAITDVHRKELVIADIVARETTGLADVTIPASLLSIIDPQFLMFTIYNEVENEDDTVTRTVMYADTQFGANGNMELVGSALPIETPVRIIAQFNPITNELTRPYTVTHFSEAVDMRKPNQLVAAATESVFFDFNFNKSNALVTIQFTEESVVSTSTVWTDVMAFGVFPGDVTATKEIEYPVYNRNIQWARVKFIQNSYNGVGATVDIGKADTSGLSTEYTFKPNQPGKGYKVGEVYTIPGSRVGSPGLGAWALTVASVDGNGGVKEWTPLAEMPVAESGNIDYKNTPVTDPAHYKSVDKVTIRL
jgi:hypothetical protein